MRKVKVLLVVAALMVSSAGISQIVIDKSDMPSKNDTVRISTGLNISFIDPSQTGEDYTWDFSELTPFKQRIDTFVTVLSTPPPANYLFMLSADFALRMAGNLPFPGVPVSDPFQYYKSTDNSFNMVGFALKMQGFGIPAVFSDPDVLYKFPLEYGDVDSSFSGVDMDITGVGYIKVDRKRKNTVDGWGTLTTPYGTFDVLRVKSEVDEYDSIYIDDQEMGIGIPYSYTEYKWLGKSQKAPLLTVKDVIGGLIVEYPDVKRGSLGIKESRPEMSTLKSYPNPVTNQVTVEFILKQKLEASVSIINAKGEIVFEIPNENFNRGKNRINLDLKKAGLSKGIYFIKLNSGNQSMVSKIVFLP